MNRANCNNWTGDMCEAFYRTGVHDPLCCNARNQGPNPIAVPLKPETGRGGWPLVPSTRFSGELTLACPKCGATNVTLTGAYAVYGTGPTGRGRLGDPGAISINRCESCHHETRFP